MTSIDTEKKILEGSIQTLNELKRKMRRLHRDLGNIVVSIVFSVFIAFTDKDIENIRMGVFGSIQLMKRSMNDIRLVHYLIALIISFITSVSVVKLANMSMEIFSSKR